MICQDFNLFSGAPGYSFKVGTEFSWQAVVFGNYIRGFPCTVCYDECGLSMCSAPEWCHCGLFYFF